MNAHGHNSATHYFDDETSGAFYRKGLLCPAVPISQFKKLHEIIPFPRASHICVYTYACGQKKIESHFSDRLTFSNIRGRTSRQIYRLALPLFFSMFGKSRIFLFNAHLALFVRRMTQLQSLNYIGKYRHLVN